MPGILHLTYSYRCRKQLIRRLYFRYLEERVAFLCHDLISILVVVGQGRPSPALLVEPLAGSPDNIEINGHGQTSLRSLIASRLKPLTSSKDGSTLYPHERIKPEYIVVLPKGSLPVSSVSSMDSNY